MTASKLHRLFAVTDRGDEFEGGFSTDDRGCHFRVASACNDAYVDLHVQLSGQGFGNASVFHRLEASEARELSLALDLAADAAEKSKESE